HDALPISRSRSAPLVFRGRASYSKGIIMSTTVAFITGGNRGLGLETARGLGRQGITVVIGVRDLARGNAAVNELKQEGINAEVILFDSLNPATFQDVYRHLDNKYGKLDILVNNAGVALGPLFGNNACTASQDLLRQTFDVNFFAVIGLTQ